MAFRSVHVFIAIVVCVYATSARDKVYTVGGDLIRELPRRLPPRYDGPRSSRYPVDADYAPAIIGQLIDSIPAPIPKNYVMEPIGDKEAVGIFPMERNSAITFKRKSSMFKSADEIGVSRFIRSTDVVKESPAYFATNLAISNLEPSDAYVVKGDPAYFATNLAVSNLEPSDAYVVKDNPAYFATNLSASNLEPSAIYTAPAEFPSHLARSIPTEAKDAPVEFPSFLARLIRTEGEESHTELPNPSHRIVQEQAINKYDAPFEFPAHHAFVTPAPADDSIPLVFPAHLAKITMTEDTNDVPAKFSTDIKGVAPNDVPTNVHTVGTNLDNVPVMHNDGPGEVLKMVFEKNDPHMAMLKDPRVFKKYIRASVDLANILPDMIDQMDVLTKRCLHLSWENDNVLVMVKTKPMANGECLRYVTPLNTAEELIYARQRWADLH